MSAHVVLNLLNELGKEMKCEACRAFISFSQRVVLAIFMKSLVILREIK